MRHRVRIRLKTADGSRVEPYYLSRLPCAGEIVSGLLPASGSGLASDRFIVGLSRHFANALATVSDDSVLDGECVGEFFDGEERRV